MPKTPSIFNFLLLLPFLFQSSLTGIIPQTSSNNVVSIQMDRINYKKCGMLNIGGQNVTLTFATGLSDFWIVKEKQSESLLKPLNKLVEIKDAGIKGPLVNSQVSVSFLKILITISFLFHHLNKDGEENPKFKDPIFVDSAFKDMTY